MVFNFSTLSLFKKHCTYKLYSRTRGGNIAKESLPKNLALINSVFINMLPYLAPLSWRVEKITKKNEKTVRKSKRQTGSWFLNP